MRDLLPPFPQSRSINEKWTDIARQVPGGWGGWFLVDGQSIHYLVHPAQRDEAFAALHALGVTRWAHLDAVVWQGRWDFAQLYDWYSYIRVAIDWPSYPNIFLTTTDIDEVRNRLVYGVRDRQAAKSLAAVFDTANLPCELTIIEVVGIATG